MTDEQKTALDIARYLAENGVPIFIARPARDRNGAWVPDGGHGGTGYMIPAGWQNTKPDPAVVDRWQPGDALCAVMGHVVDGFDVDPRSGGADSLMLMEEEGLVPRSYGRQATPSDGNHDLIATLGVRSLDKVLPGVDVKAGDAGGQGRGFLFLAPTVKLSKTTGVPGTYTWVEPPNIELLSLLGGDATGDKLAVLMRSRGKADTYTGPTYEGPAYADLSAADRRLADSHVESVVGLWEARLTEALGWTEEGQDGKGRGWERLARDTAWALAKTAAAPWTGLDEDRARELYESALPEEFAATTECSGKWYDGIVAKAQQQPVEPPWWTDDFGLVGGGDPLAGFWPARRELALIHEWARARMVAPTAVLGAVLARICAATPPWVVLPPTIGKAAGLNLFVALVGRSGSGKGAADGVAQDALRLPAESAFTRIGAGSGEGIAHLFARRTKLGVEQHTTSVLMSLAEIDTLVGLVLRPGSTILPELRKAWTGEDLGFAYVDPAKRITVAEYAYRLALLAGVQPERAGALFDDASGGTPQRFVWLPAVDPTIPDEKTPEPEPIVWRKPRAWPKQVGGRGQLPVCPEAITTVEQAARDRNRGLVSALDGHALLSRLKVAALLGILDGRAEVSAEDWRLAGMVMEQSDRTRTAARAVLADAAGRAGTARATEDGRQEVIRSAVVAEDGLKRACQALSRKLHREDGWVTGKDLRDVLGANRAFYQEALDTLTATGTIKVENVEYKGQPGQRVHLAGGAS